MSDKDLERNDELEPHDSSTTDVATPLKPDTPLPDSERQSARSRWQKRQRTMDREDLEPGSEYKLTHSHSRTPARDPNYHDPAMWPDDLVEWDSPNDPKNPRNWPLRMKMRVTLQLGLTTMGASFASSSFSPTFDILEDVFDISQPVATLSLLSFVLGL